jgi:hypothetical protein
VGGGRRAKGSVVSVKDDLVAYTDRLGFISGEKNPGAPSGNALLFTAEAMLVLRQQGCLAQFDRDLFLIQVSEACEIITGLYKRPPPYSQDQESQDDYIGLAAASYFLGTSHARDMLEYGREHVYRWRFLRLPYQYDKAHVEESRVFDAWLGRFVTAMIHIQWAAGERPALWRRLWWACSVAFSGSKDDQDPWLLNWLMIHTMDGRSRIGVVAASIWRWRLRRAFPDGIRQVFARYFNDPGHPLAKYAID